MARIDDQEAGGLHVKAFLDMIAFSEGTTQVEGSDEGYNVLFGGKLFADYADHPRVKTYETHDEFIHDGKLEYTTAAGRYQIIARTFDAYKAMLKLPDFSPLSQDRIALRMMAEAHALPLLQVGNLPAAIHACSHLWASLPGNSAQQPQRPYAKLADIFLDNGGFIA